MFTGIVSDVGTVLGLEQIAAGQRAKIGTVYDPEGIDIGASIACSGVCHTVVAKGRDREQSWFTVESATETLEVTTVKDWKVGQRVNLERSLTMGAELGGHIVLGHADGIAEIVEYRQHPESVYIKFECAPEFARFIPKKGSVCLDGTSLTVNEAEGSTFSVFLIPHTLDVTTWSDRHMGDEVNLEVDMMARYVARLAEFPGLAEIAK